MRSILSDDFGSWLTLPPEVEAEVARVTPRLGAIGSRIYWLATTGSTNDLAAQLADLDAPEGTVIVAETQTAGRGRLGRAWFSPPGAGLYVSVILRPSAVFSSSTNPASLLTLASGVALAESVEQSTGLRTQIKWPNDLLVGRRKLAGILTEAAAQAGRLQFIVVGLGLNLQTAAYPAELADRVTSIEAELGRSVDRALVFAETLASLAERYDDLQHARFDAILTAWRQRASLLPGAIVEWVERGAVLRGRAEDIDDTGALLVRVDGRLERVIAGEVKWI